MGRGFFLLILSALGALFVRGCVMEGIVVVTASMEPALSVGRHVFVNKMVYKVRSPRRGEIVVFPSPVEKKELVKRIIALEGDEVRIEKKQVILNGKPLQEPYVIHTRSHEMLKGDNLEVGFVPQGRVFLLGDNRDWSGDSRDWVDAKGDPIYFVPVDRLRGKLVI